MIKLAAHIFLFVLAAAPLAAQKSNLPECGKIYKCVIPDSCTTVGAAFTEAAEAEIVTKNTEVNNDCPAIIRFHSYTHYWMRVSIESMNTQTTSIIFSHLSKYRDLATFECVLENGQVTGKYKLVSTIGTIIHDITKSATNLIDKNGSPLKCTFEVKLLDPTQKRLHISVNCNPYMLKFMRDEYWNPDHVYSKLEYSIGSFKCDATFPRMEYRLEGSVSYKSMTEIKCVNDKFTISEEGSIPIDHDDRVYVRCVADAKLFCNYKVNTIQMSSEDSKFTEPDQDTPNPPMRCHEFKKIPVSSVRKGTLTNHLPDCHAGGSLKLHPSLKPVEVSCNTDTGKFEYTIDGKVFLVEDATFVCEYPTNNNNAIRKHEEKKDAAFKAGGITTAVIIVVSLLVVALILVAIPNCRAYYLKKRTMKKDKDEWEANNAAKDEQKKVEHEEPTKKVVKKNRDVMTTGNGLGIKWFPSMLSFGTNADSDVVKGGRAQTRAVNMDMNIWKDDLKDESNLNYRTHWNAYKMKN